MGEPFDGGGSGACVADLQEQCDLHPRCSRSRAGPDSIFLSSHHHTSHENCIPTSPRLEQGAQLATGRLCTAYMLVSVILGLTIGLIIFLVWRYWREMRVLVSATVDLVQLVANIVRDLGQREVEHDNPPTGDEDVGEEPDEDIGQVRSLYHCCGEIPNHEGICDSSDADTAQFDISGKLPDNYLDRYSEIICSSLEYETSTIDQDLKKISKKKKMVEMLPCIEVGYVPGVAEIVEAGVVVEKETEHTRLGSDKSHFSALSIILLTIMSYIITEETVIVTLPLQPDLWLDFTPDQDSRLLEPHYSGLVCPKLGGGVIVSAMANVRFGIHLSWQDAWAFHSFSEDWEKRASEDGSFRSFIVEKDDGTEILRNSRFLKHQWKPDHITWADQQ